MTIANVQETHKKSNVTFPHSLILIVCIILFACFLTYVLPSGVYEKDPVTGIFNPNSFHYVEKTPVSPMAALLSIQPGIARAATIISLLLVIGGATAVILSVGAIESIINYAIKRLEKRSVIIIIPSIIILMSILGALAGNDSMLAFVAVGVLICKKLKLDRIVAVAIFYLAYITGQAAGPTTAIALTAQSLVGVSPVSGLAARIVIWALLTAAGVIYTTRYALKIHRNPELSILGGVESSNADDAIADGDAKLELRAVLSIVMLFGCFVLFAFGAKNFKWSFEYLVACILVTSVSVAAFYRLAPNRFANIFVGGARDMGGVCLVLGFAQVVGMTLNSGNVIHTIAHSVAGLLKEAGSGIAAVGLFIFNLLFNIIVPSGTTQAAIILPVTTPMGDVMGITRQVMSLTLQLGDGLTNCVTPLSSVMIGAITLGGVTYDKWLRFVFPLLIVNVLIGGAAVYILQMINWM